MQQRVLMLNDRRINGYTIYENAPIGFIMMFGGQIAPQGYILCDGRELSRRLYADLFNVIGTTYGKGDGLYTFNVPDFRDRAPQGASAKNPVGRKLEAGLPNITGDCQPWGYQNALDPHGCFDQKDTNRSAFNVSDSGRGSTLVFDASKSNAIYGASETVQSPALTTVFYIKATKTKPEKDVAPKTEIIPTEEYVRELVLKSFPMGELRYFPEKEFHYGYLPADGKIFLPEIYPAFFEYWKKHFEEECGYDNYGYPRLPDYRNMFIRGNDGTRSSYEKQKDSAPNLKGNFYGTTGINDEILFSFMSHDGYEWTPGGQYRLYQDRRDFDAHRYSRTYGRRNEIAPANIPQYIYIKVI